jgi:putative FmdB family regulatory protein
MPLYEYRCSKCGEEFEINLRFSEADRIPACPKCESPKTKKIISKVAVYTVSGSGSSSSTSSNSCGTSGGFT